MKKILSLVIAVIMLLSMAVSTSAITIWGSDSLTTSNDTSSLKDLIYYLYLYGQYDDDYNNIVSGNVSGNDWWYGSCDKCNGGAFYYRVSNTVYWKCLETNCGEHGSSAPEIDRWWAGECGYCKGTAFYYIDEDTVYWRCVEDNCGKKGYFDLNDDDDEIEDVVRCGECGRANLVFVTTYVRNDKIYNEYYCRHCMKSVVKIVSEADLDLEIGTSAQVTPCAEKDCKKIAYFDSYVVENDSIYLVYTCGNNHTTKRILNNYSWIGGDSIRGDYKVSVICSSGGTYSISGGKYADYGDKKTITFTPMSGYTITDVEINGKSIGAVPSVTMRITNDTIIRVTFTRVQSITKNYVITAKSTGKGTITAKKNYTTVLSDKVSAKYNDKVTYTFKPADGYAIHSVKVDGKSVGKVSSYTFTNLDANHAIEVVFAWKNPYTDVSSNYTDAVEYVTKAGIMSYYGKKTTFAGNVKVTVEDFALALAEMTDTANTLDDSTDRLKWAIKYDLVNPKEDLDDICSVQRACDMVKVYLEALEDINDISFDKVNSKDSAKETAIDIGMVTAKIYEKNRDLNRYDLAAVCYLISEMEYDD